MKVLVLMGGASPERHVSLDSGKAVLNALRARGNEVIALDSGAGVELPDSVTESGEAAVQPLPPDMHELTLIDRESTYRSLTVANLSDIDVVFIGLHGGSGEDGTVQALLELANVPYTGSGVLASALAMDKDISKKIFERERIPTPDWIIIKPGTDDEYRSRVEEIVDRFGLPVIVKPADGGSTVGLTLVKDKNNLVEALAEAGELTKKIMVEKYIAGRELTVAVLAGEPLPVVEILPKHELYDYECKYSPGMCSYEVPADIPDDLAARLAEYGKLAYDSLNCEGYARVDFRLDRDGKPYCLEVNTLPGMTGTSLVPKAAKQAGMSFEDLIERICKEAIKRFEQR